MIAWIAVWMLVMGILVDSDSKDENPEKSVFFWIFVAVSALLLWPFILGTILSENFSKKS
jgi:hypothetical protein